MTDSTLPLYGRFHFSAILDMIEKMKLISDSFMAGVPFYAYMTTYTRNSFYGLDYEEIRSTFTAHAASVRSISASCSGPGGKSVSINVRFPKDSLKGEGQFVIVSGSKFNNLQISKMILGEWEPVTEEDILKKDALGSLMFQLIDYKQKEEEAEKQKLIEAQRKQEEEAKLRQVQAAKIREEKRKKEKPILKTRSDSFLIDENISVSVILQMLDHLSNYFLEGAPFNIRVVTLDGEPYSDIGQKGLRRFFEMRRRIVSRVNLDAATISGELVDITIVFNNGQDQATVYLEITTFNNENIREHIRKTLLFTKEFRVKPQTPEVNMLHEMFRFEQDDFSLDRVIRLITAISTKYLQKEVPTVFLSTLQGETYPALSLRQLRSIYLQHNPNVSFLLFGINQALTGQTFSLMFQFQSPGHEPYGSLSMMWGDEKIHKIVRALLWEQLQLNSYQINVPPDSTTEPQLPISAPVTGTTEIAEVESKSGDFLITPTFKTRNFTPKPRTSLIVMPLEAYWSETLWANIQQTLKGIGFNSEKADALFSENSLEDTWTKINEVDILIADLTYKHPDVFYKVGIAHTLGKKVIIISQHLRDIPKDFTRFPFHVYDNNINGLEKLSDWLINELRQK